MIAFINCLGLGTTITQLIVCIYKYKEIGDFEYKQLASLHVINALLFMTSMRGIRIAPTYLYILTTIVSWIILLWDIIFGKKHFEELNDWNYAYQLLEQCNIDYKNFKKLSRQEQIDLLENAYVTWDDGTTDKLIEEESDWNWVVPIIKRK